MVRTHPVGADDINETVRLRLAALDTRDALHRLAKRLTAASNNPQHQAEALATAERISRTYADILRLAPEEFSRAPA